MLTVPDPAATQINDADTLFQRRRPQGARDAFALGVTRALRFIADTFFAKRYGHRAVVLETVAAVPGMVGGMAQHLRSLRRMKDDEGWIKTLLEEADNERMHLMTFIEIARPSWFERLLVLLAQGVFFNLYFVVYLFFPRTAHRIVGYFEEEAVVSYTQYLEEIDAGRHPNPPAPRIAIDYWNLPETATLRDVVVAVRADEAGHRDVNHRMADALADPARRVSADAIKSGSVPAQASL
jgi:ubiquinol oxidase